MPTQSHASKPRSACTGRYREVRGGGSRLWGCKGRAALWRRHAWGDQRVAVNRAEKGWPQWCWRRLVLRGLER